jgi:hypothetical protein
MEILIVIGLAAALHLVVNRAQDNQTPLQTYASYDLAFTRQSLDFFSRSTAYYEFFVPSIPLRWDTTFKDGTAFVGNAKVNYGYDNALVEGPVNREDQFFLPLSVAGGEITGGLSFREKNKKLAVGCPAIFSANGKIAVLPATPEARILVNALIAKNQNLFSPSSSELKDLVQDLSAPSDVVAQARSKLINAPETQAVVLIQTVQESARAIAYTNTNGYTLACTLVNAAVPDMPVYAAPTFDAAVVPFRKDAVPANSPLKELPDSKPALLLVVSSAQNTPAIADALYHAFD